MNSDKLRSSQSEAASYSEFSTFMPALKKQSIGGLLCSPGIDEGLSGV